MMTQVNDIFLALCIRLQNLTTSDEGQDLVEYALLVCLIALAAVAGIRHVATAVNSVFGNVSSTLA